MNKKLLSILPLVSIAASLPAQVITFDEASDLLGSDALFYNGADFAGGFAAGDLFFANTFTDFGGGFTGWSGWALSRSYDTTTPGFFNQYSAIPGVDADGDAEGLFAMAFTSGGSTIQLPTFASGTPTSIAVTNATYAYLSMRDGDDFAKQFGGPDGSDPDFFTLTIAGSFRGFPVGSPVEVALADFTGTENVLLSDWINVDLTALGARVDTLTFSLASSDVGQFGMNTPAYVAVDNVDFAVTTAQDTAPFDLGDGWISLAGFGAFYAPDGVDGAWSFHLPLGWVNAAVANAEATRVFLYGANSGAWYWVTAEGFPWIYELATETWLYILPESTPEAVVLYDTSVEAARQAQPGL